MVKGFISLILFCAFIAGSAQKALESSLELKSQEVELNQIPSLLNNVARLVANPAPSPASKKPEPLLELIELSADDFIPSRTKLGKNVLKPSLEESKPEFVKIKKSIEVFQNNKLEIAATEAKKSSADLEVENTFTVNGSEPVKLYGFKKGARIQPSYLAANFEPIQIPTESLDTQKIVAELEFGGHPEKSANVSGKIEPIKNENNFNDKSSGAKLDRISTAFVATEKSSNAQAALKNIKSHAPKNDHPAMAENAEHENSEGPELDRISTALAATEKSANQYEEPVFFDYSKPEPTPKKANPALSAREGKKAQEVHKNPAISEILKGMGKAFEKDSDKKTKRLAMAKNHAPPMEELTTEAFAPAEPFKKKMNTQNHSSHYRLTVLGRNINSSKNEPVNSFEVEFADDRDDIQRSNMDGAVEFRDLLNTSYAIRRGTIFAGSYMPTTVDFVLEGQQVNLTVPIISKQSFNNMVVAEGLKALGAHVLVELDQLTEDVDFHADTNYESKLFLDRNLKVVKRGESDYSFILFVGVEPGNKIISFKTYKNEITSKIIHVTDQEIYFDFNFYEEVKGDEFELYEDNLLSKEPGLLSLDEHEIVDLSYDSQFVKKTVNRMQALKSLLPVGSRKYYELKHLPESVFVGRWDSDYIDVPSESYMRFALNTFNTTSLADHCMVQINLEKQAKELSYNGKSFRGHMRIQAKILDKDGIFYKDLSDQSNRIFLLGEEQGTISVKIKYVDNSVDFLQSFCSDSNYVVEQL